MRVAVWLEASHRLVLGILRGLPPPPVSDAEADKALRQTLHYIERSERLGGGSSAAFQLGLGIGGQLGVGWADAYPETTGYLVPTLYDAADRLHDARWETLATRWTDWLKTVQNPEGWFSAGVVSREAVPAVFNTAQALQGLVTSYLKTGDADTRQAATQASTWLVANQEANGRWRSHAYRRGYSPAYYSRVAFPLAQAGRALDDPSALVAARRSLDDIVDREREGAWIADVGFTPGRSAFLHTIAYTVEGLIEGGILSGHQAAVHLGRRAATKLLVRFEVDRHLGGAYGPSWAPTSWYRCITGEAQMACIWLRDSRREKDLRSLNAALKVIDRVLQARWRLPGFGGAIPGSKPFLGRYVPLRFPNWAAKFTADGLLERSRTLAWWDARCESL